MKVLRELIRIVNPGKLRYAQLVGQQNNSSNNADELYRLIHQSKIETDEDIANHFFSAHSRKRRYTRNLKNRLRRRLMNALFLIEPDEKSSDVQKAYFQCYRNMAGIHILSGMGALRTFIPFADRTIKKAQLYGFTEIVLSLSRLLRRYYGEIVGDLKKYSRYANIAQQYAAILYAENLGEHYNTRVLLNFSNSRAAQTHLAEEIQTYIDQMKVYRDRHKSYQLNLSYYRLCVTKFQIIAAHQEVVKNCNEAIAYFESLERETPIAAQFFFLFQSIPSYIHLKKYDQSITAIEKCLSMVGANTYNYYAILFYQIFVSFHSGRYDLAIKVLDSVPESRDIPTDNLREQWLIAEAYVHFFTDRPFKLARFLNQVPIFEQDKRGNNINILILQTLFLLRDQRFSAIIDRMESLKQYVHRYLRKDETYRSSCFIKMLLQLPTADFHRVAVERKVQPLLKRLQQVPLNLAHQSGELEIVPYEMLWERVVALLDDKFHKVRKPSNLYRSKK